MDVDNYKHGTPSWVDLGSPDTEASAAFYSALFGWEVLEESGPDAGGYRMCMMRDRAVAGLGPQMNPGPPFWAMYVTVESADDAAAAVTAAGGQMLMEPMDVLTAGRMAVCMDSVGAAFSIWQPRDHPGSMIVNEPGAFSWGELQTTDVEASKAFYNAVFGWEATTHDGPMPYTELKLAGASIAGMMPKPAEAPADMPPFWGVYFAVDDCDEAVAKVGELGGGTIMPPMDIEPGRVSVVHDPHGAVFTMIKMPS
ncbi:MAG: VOC family protein [Actinomycetota bacterium]